jgi:hypothetical protein
MNGTTPIVAGIRRMMMKWCLSSWEGTLPLRTLLLWIGERVRLGLNISVDKQLTDALLCALVMRSEHMDRQGGLFT